MHTIFINKDIYIIDKMETLCLKSGNSFLTILKVSDIHFPSVKRTLYVSTMKFTDSYFNQRTYSDVASLFEFLNKERRDDDDHEILLADFGCQNWNVLNRDWRFTSGDFNCVSYIDKRGCVNRHGILFNTNLKCTINIEQIFDIRIDCELLQRLQFENPSNKVGSIQLGTDTEKICMSIKYRDIVNFTKSKILPDKHNLHIEDYIEYTAKKDHKFTRIETILNELLEKLK